jgi:formylglycine-generating enzyme required for sulfatase activity
VYPPNPWGFYDMHGNVWEWMQDGYEDNYRGVPTDGSAWNSGSSTRVVRGGSWYGFPRFLRSASRGWINLKGRVGNFGFRVAKTVI